jgi:hypothetical protein
METDKDNIDMEWRNLKERTSMVEPTISSYRKTRRKMRGMSLPSNSGISLDLTIIDEGVNSGNCGIGVNYQSQAERSDAMQHHSIPNLCHSEPQLELNRPFITTTTATTLPLR